jgi:hypothetical protein
MPTPRPSDFSGRTRGPGRRRTIYLDEEAERDLRLLLTGLTSLDGHVTRSEGVRRALRVARAAMEGESSWQ